MTVKRRDGRRNNGSEKTDLTEDKQLVRGPAKLIQAMRERAERDGQTINHAWRCAAELYLARR